MTHASVALQTARADLRSHSMTAERFLVGAPGEPAIAPGRFCTSIAVVEGSHAPPYPSPRSATSFHPPHPSGPMVPRQYPVCLAQPVACPPGRTSRE